MTYERLRNLYYWLVRRYHSGNYGKWTSFWLKAVGHLLLKTVKDLNAFSNRMPRIVEGL